MTCLCPFSCHDCPHQWPPAELELIAETTCQICGVICTDAVCATCGPARPNYTDVI